MGFRARSNRQLPSFYLPLAVLAALVAVALTLITCGKTTITGQINNGMATVNVSLLCPIHDGCTGQQPRCWQFLGGPDHFFSASQWRPALHPQRRPLGTHVRGPDYLLAAFTDNASTRH